MAKEKNKLAKVTGLSAYEAWEKQPENLGKSEQDYVAWLEDHSVDAVETADTDSSIAMEAFFSPMEEGIVLINDYPDMFEKAETSLGRPFASTAITSGWERTFDTEDKVFGTRSLVVTRIAGGTSPFRFWHYVDHDIWRRVNPAGKIYCCGWVKGSRLRTSISFLVGSLAVYCKTEKDKWTFCSVIIKNANNGSIGLAVDSMDPADFAIGETVKIDGLMFINLTDCFGAGKEPDVWQMDEIVQNIGYFAEEYSSGRVNNDLPSSAARLNKKKDCQRDPSIFRVCAYNEVGFCTHPFAWKQTVQVINPDIICGQESFKYVGTDPEKTGDPIVFGGRLKHGHFYSQWPKFVTDFDKGKRLSSAYPLIEVSTGNLPLQGYIRAVVMIAGKRVAVYDIHNPHARPIGIMTAHVQNIYNLVSSDREKYVIAAGDWNTPDSHDFEGDQIDETTGIANWSAFDVFIDAGWTMGQGVHGIVWNTRCKDDGFFYGDNVLVSPGLKVLNSGMSFPGLDTDHIAFWSDLTFDDNPA